ARDDSEAGASDVLNPGLIDAPAGSEMRAPKAATDRRRSRRGGPVDPEVVAGVVAHLGSGHGRRMACMKAGLSYRRFLGLLRHDGDFADRVLMTESAREEACEQLLFRLAT